MDKVIDAVTQLPAKGEALINSNAVIPVVALVVVLLLELGWCFFGYKAMKVFATIAGFAVGVAIGTVISELLGLDGIAAMVVPLIAGIGCALAGFILYKAGIFIAVLTTGTYAAREVLTNDVKTDFDANMILLIAIVIGLVLAILTMFFFRTVLIISSGLAGGMGFASVLLSHMVQITWDASTATIARCAIGLVLALCGIIYQFRSSR